MPTQPQVKSCVIYPKPNPHSRARLFCFPYAGGTAAIFRTWPNYLPAEIEVCAIQYPGRGSRLAERLNEHVEEMVDSSYDDLKPLLNKPFAFFGHSMGALVSYEFARRLQREQRPGPVGLFVSGCTAPHMRAIDKVTYDLPEPEFIAELRELQGTPPEVLDNKELMQLMLPIIRADFKTSQTYEYVPGPPLECPIRAFGGLKDDMVTREKVEGWGEHTSAGFRAQMLPGDHFFLNSSQPLLTRIVSQELIVQMNRNIARPN
ncbi:MAG TPA: thioesterase II family protein [Pyrinomonadaceae bacterium]|nr:thioesterase II family protein [Pyrinomonadaceae bacterium]